MFIFSTFVRAIFELIIKQKVKMFRLSMLDNANWNTSDSDNGNLRFWQWKNKLSLYRSNWKTSIVKLFKNVQKLKPKKEKKGTIWKSRKKKELCDSCIKTLENWQQAECKPLTPLLLSNLILISNPEYKPSPKLC